MNLSRKSKTVLFITIIIVILTSTTWLAFAKDQNSNLKTDPNIQAAKGIADFSGLSEDIVLKLSDSVASWETVQRNIFVYKKILGIVSNSSDAYIELFEIARTYQPQDMLTVYQYLEKNFNDFSLAESLLEKHSSGESFEDIFAEGEGNKSYKTYKPANENQIRQWLSQGYVPQDIISADEIARAKDKDLAEVLTLKTENATWQQIAAKLKYKLPYDAHAPVTIDILGETGKMSFSGEDYETAIRNANKKAEEDIKVSEDRFYQESGISNEQLQTYKDQGLTVWDLKNATKLSGKTGASMDEILQDRKDGKAWKDIIATYSG